MKPGSLDSQDRNAGSVLKTVWAPLFSVDEETGSERRRSLDSELASGSISGPSANVTLFVASSLGGEMQWNKQASEADRPGFQMWLCRLLSERAGPTTSPREAQFPHLESGGGHAKPLAVTARMK